MSSQTNFVTWLSMTAPPYFEMSWRFEVVRAPGLAMVFFAAMGCNGEDVLSDRLQRRDGSYDCYRYGDIDTYHLSFYRRALPEERAFRTVNLRHSPGFRLLARGADPMADVADAPRGGYLLTLRVSGGGVEFLVQGLTVLDWRAPDKRWRKGMGGRIGFRQVAPLVAEYRDLQVRELAV